MKSKIKKKTYKKKYIRKNISYKKKHKKGGSGKSISSKSSSKKKYDSDEDTYKPTNDNEINQLFLNQLRTGSRVDVPLPNKFREDYINSLKHSKSAPYTLYDNFNYKKKPTSRKTLRHIASSPQPLYLNNMDDYFNSYHIDSDNNDSDNNSFDDIFTYNYNDNEIIDSPHNNYYIPNKKKLSKTPIIPIPKSESKNHLNHTYLSKAPIDKGILSKMIDDEASSKISNFLKNKTRKSKKNKKDIASSKISKFLKNKTRKNRKNKT